MTRTIFWQGAYGHIPLGHADAVAGPFLPGAGCVVSTAAMLHNELRPDLPALDPKTANELLRGVPGAFVDGTPLNRPGPLLSWPAAAPALGLRAGASVPLGPAGDASKALACITDTLKAGGRLAVRVSVNGGVLGQHTCAGFELSDNGFLLVGCPALAVIVKLDWPRLENAGVKWNGKPHPYRVVAVRPLFRA